MIDAFVTDSPVFLSGIATVIAAVLGGGVVGLSAWAALAVRDGRHLHDGSGPAKAGFLPGVSLLGSDDPDPIRLSRG